MLAAFPAGIERLQIQKAPDRKDQGLYKKDFRRRPTLPHSFPCSTIGAKELNFCVRDGNRCFLFAIATEKMAIYFPTISNLHQSTSHGNTILWLSLTTN